MAGHHKGGEVSPEDPASQQYRVQRLLPPGAHSMGESPVQAWSPLTYIMGKESALKTASALRQNSGSQGMRCS